MQNDLFAFTAAEQKTPMFQSYSKWDAANPHFYPLFRQFTLQLARRGLRNLGVSLIFERIRWESMVKTAGEAWKLNNNYRSIYARRFMAENPQHEGIFRTRELTAVLESEIA